MRQGFSIGLAPSHVSFVQDALNSNIHLPGNVYRTVLRKHAILRYLILILVLCLSQGRATRVWL